MRRSVVLLIYFFVLNTTIRGIAQASPSTVRLSTSDGLRDSQPLLKKIADEALDLAQKKLKLPLEENIFLHVSSRPDDHNGLTTVIPNNRIFVYSEAPEANSGIGISEDYLRDTLVHEYAHMLSMQRHAGVFSLLNVFLGNSARPNGSWPRWIHEGLAVWTEAAVGGRPRNGAIDLDLRLLADGSRRLKRSLLNNNDLDGGRERSERIGAGQLSYTFGYLLTEALHQKNSALPAAFVEDSSSSLGISFRKTFQDEKISLDQVFNEERARWEKTPLPVAEVPGKRIASQNEIWGPFSAGGDPSWIEMDSSQRVYLSWLDSAKRKTFRQRWLYPLAAPRQAFRVSADQWIVLLHSHPEWDRSGFYDASLPFRRQAWLYSSQSGELLCRFSIPDRLREISVRGKTLSWIRSSDEGYFTAEKAQWTKDCSLQSMQVLAQSREAFERLSGIYADDKVWAFSRSEGRNSFREHLVTSEGEIHLSVPLSYPKPLPNGNWAALEMSPAHWGPVLLKRSGSSWSLARWKLPTGSQIFTVSQSGEVYAQILRWEKEDLYRLDPMPSAPVNLSASSAFSSGVKAEASGAEIEVDKEASAWPSILPHFWLPFGVTDSSGFIVGGSTFYEDVSQRWAGSTQAGYDSQIEKVFAATSLEYRPDTLPWLGTPSLSAAWSPRRVSILSPVDPKASQNRWNLGFATRYPFLLRPWILGSLGVGADYLNIARVRGVPGYANGVPKAFLVLRSPFGINHDREMQRLSQARSGIFSSIQYRRIESYEMTADLFAHTSFRPLGLRLSGQYAQSSRNNYPISYFTWGGTPNFGFGNSNYLNRGFPPEFVVTQKLLRMAGETSLSLWNPHQASLSWNRARLSALDWGLVAETITWQSWSGRRQLGHDYFVTGGSTLSFYGGGLHYIDYRIVLGAFRGFGDFGDTRFSLTFETGLDI